MRLLLTRPIAQRLQRELRDAGRREIGGLLLGEHLHDDVFRLVDLTVQRAGGSKACFVRRPQAHHAELNQFFERTGANYTRFNYLGEWHSHPSFAPVPSTTDLETMQSIVSDASVGANFVVLMIVKLAGKRQLQLSASAFRADAPPAEVHIEFEPEEATVVVEENETATGVVLRWVRRLLKW